jgi:hypothetical protein
MWKVVNVVSLVIGITTASLICSCVQFKYIQRRASSLFCFSSCTKFIETLFVILFARTNKIYGKIESVLMLN